MALPYLDAQAQNGADTPYMAHLLLDEAVPVDRAAVVAALESRLGTVVPVDESQALHFALPDYPARVGEGTSPVQLAVLALEGIGVDELGAALRQSWSWKDAGQVAAHCRASLTLTDFFGAGLDRRIRLALFHGAMTALLDVLPVRAVQWLPSQQVIAPDEYRERLRAGEGLRGSALNVRRFKLPSGEGYVQLLDTVGLRAFGLPDLQCTVEDGDRERAEDYLYAQAARMFAEGEKWANSAERHESAAPPSRAVVRVQPDDARLH